MPEMGVSVERRDRAFWPAVAAELLR